MSKSIIITKIHDIFTHHEKDYILFSTNHSNYKFLYFKDRIKSNKSLFFGDNFMNLISLYRKDPKIECIECSLGANILGGIALDGENQVEFNFSIQECNEILKKLKLFLKDNPVFIELF